MRYIRQFYMVTKHKLFVLVECWMRGLFLLGITHDISKYLLCEFIPYARYSNGGRRKMKDSSGYYKPYTDDEEFNLALHHHVINNKHHWQYWVMNVEDGEVVPLRIPDKYIVEMICDWIGAGRMRCDNVNGARDWYITNHKKIIIHEDSRKYIEEYLGIC